MPLLILSLLVGLTVFFFKSRPEETVQEDPIASRHKDPAIPETGNKEESEASMPETETESKIQAVPVEPTPVSSNSSEESTTARLSESFTDWMSPADLDTYIRTQNAGHEKGFWQRGYWITAVEGRWKDNGHQFRISYEKMPAPDSWEWQYRVDQTRDSFIENIQVFALSGFDLVQSNSYQRPDGSQRFQGVWRRDVETPTIADTAAGNSNSVTPLDVNNLNFR